MLVKLYVETGKIQFAFRHLPLEQRHPSAVRAAEAAECSGRQGKFWQMHDALFRTGKALDSASLFARAEEIGIDSDRFRKCMDGEATARVREDIAEAQSLGITATPSFLFGTIEPDGRRLKVVRRESGAIPADGFVAIVEQLLKSVAPSVR